MVVLTNTPLKSGVIAQQKGKQLPLTVSYIPYIGFFIGTEIVVDNFKRPFTRESVEVWDTIEEAKLALSTGNWLQALSCNLEGMA